METILDLSALAEGAKRASHHLARLTTDEKNAALMAVADELERQADAVIVENALDLEAGRDSGLSEAMLDRLLLSPERIAGLVADTRRIAGLPDPVGQETLRKTLPNGLVLTKRRVPIGVVAVIYESRPNVTIDVATLCIKSGNAVILRGGREALRGNGALARVVQAGLGQAGIPEEAVAFVSDPDRALVSRLLRMHEYVDMIIPRGGAALHELCKRESTIPVMTGGIGICHVFVDESADLERAVDVVENAKVQRPSVCNALDTLLVHRAVAPRFVPRVATRLARSGVELRADPETLEILRSDGHGASVLPAGDGDFDREWLALILGIRVVGDLDEAIRHIHKHSTQHSDAILTRTPEHADRFVTEVDSAAVYVNASTRFTDGGQFGLGAEVAVSTEKLHARGPMGLEELTTYKWIGFGDGHIRE